MALLKSIILYRPYWPWLATSLAIGYAAFLQWRLYLLKKANKKNPINKKQDKLAPKHELNIDTIDRDSPFTTEDSEDDQCCNAGSSTQTDCCSSKATVPTVSEVAILQPPRPRRTAFSFFVADCSALVSLSNHNLEASNSLITNYAKQWKYLSAVKKAHFHSLSKKDKLRYEREFREYKEYLRTVNNEPPNEYLVESHDTKQSYMNASLMTTSVGEGVIKNGQHTICSDGPFNHTQDGDLDDLAFDLFCTDEMSKVRQMFAPLQRRMSGEEMLDELLKRWDLLPIHFKNYYLQQALQSKSTEEQRTNATNKRIAYCRCWKSEKFPFCNGAHQCHNNENDDKVGPLVVVWNEPQPELKALDTSIIDVDKDLDIKSFDSESPILQSSNGGDSNGEYEQMGKSSDIANSSDEQLSSDSLEMIESVEIADSREKHDDLDEDTVKVDP